MASRLSSLLVRDGLVSVRQMERAFQRQVIYGGELDTILLEMNLVPEDRLVQYLSLASGLPPAQAREADVFDSAAIKACPLEQAERFRVAPLSLDDGALRVLVHDPVDLALLEDLANELELAVQPLVVPEYRFRLLLARVFDREAEERFARLAEASQSAAHAAPVGRDKSVIIESAARPAEADREDHVVVDVPLPASAEAGVSAPESAEVSAPESAEVSAPESAEVSAPESAGDGAGAGVDVSPLSLAEARQALSEVEDRDLCFTVLLRALRSRTSYASLLTVQGGAAIGRLAIEGDSLDRESVATVLIPLDAESFFKKAVASQSPYIGPVASGVAEIDEMIGRLGGVFPSSALILPIVIRNRVVAMAYAHRGLRELGVAEVAELLPLAHVAAQSIERLILQAKKRPRSASPSAAKA